MIKFYDFIIYLPSLLLKMTFSTLPFRSTTSTTSTTSCIDCCILKKLEMNERRDRKDSKDDFEVDESDHFDDITLSPWTVCQFEFDEDYLSNSSNDSNGCRKYFMHN